MTFETLSGPALHPLLPALAGLRIAVFRDWPYLYDGDGDYEQRYLRAYADAPGAAIVVARAGDRVVGAATCEPMEQAHAPVIACFRDAGLDPARTCYFGESVLLAPWRGRGAGVRFFQEREAHARRLGLGEAAFCAVLRDPADPRCPPGHVPLDAFWSNRGYQRRPGLVVRFDWKEVGAAAETSHDLVFWTRSL
ncbi:GNAT family N-acetyltransferase [Roseomonas sp. BU-1]|uniref:GNAT family N-acetyltransferase n=1 Tax=Falsiroseomonas selenitidurans TaxID=2716335 RepID=A0ABX1E2B3_9PROT|nr:GNAT family N-acetyltransferase [Falsiroseomonas selenitidurans]OYW10511.1 MAG: GNAT family N-acetyltransferase [Rhodospirillales bacterium 12-71-4]